MIPTIQGIDDSNLIYSAENTAHKINLALTHPDQVGKD